MTPAEFSDAIARYGADLSRWPTSEMEQAARLLRTDPVAAELLEAEARLDRFLLANDPAGNLELDELTRLIGATMTRLPAGRPAFIPLPPPSLQRLVVPLLLAVFLGLLTGSLMGGGRQAPTGLASLFSATTVY